MSWSIRARHYRGLSHIEWHPEGLCALIGPNGSGKSTLLAIPELFGRALVDFAAAIDSTGGRWGLRNLDAPPGERASIEIAFGDAAWSMDFPQFPAPGEVKPREGVVVAGRPVGSATGPSVFEPSGSVLRGLLQRGEEKSLEPLGRLAYYGVHGDYDLAGLRRAGSRAGSGPPVSGDGANCFSALHWLHSRREGRRGYEFVLEGLKRAFPGEIVDLDFVSAGQTETLRIFKPGRDQPFPVHVAPSGLLAAIIHLSAVATTPPGSMVAFDDFENSLHPHAIREILAHIREFAGSNDLTVIVATHSPVVVDEFTSAPERVFVMEPGRTSLPVALSEIEDPDWLAHFSLGDLFARQEFGGPDRSPGPVSRPE